MATDLVAYAIFPDRTSFEAALEQLRAAGFRNSDVSVILPERDRTTKDLAHEINTKAPEGAATGAGTGAAVGGVLGWLIGIGALIGAGMPEIEAKRYAGRIREGGYLCSVHCDDREWAKRAREVLEATGAHDVVSTV